MNWRLQVLTRAILAYLPFADYLRRWKRKVFGYQPSVDNLSNTLAGLQQMKAALNNVERSFSGASMLEIGSGWFPTIPVMLALDGVEHIYLTDHRSNMDNVTFSATIGFLKAKFPKDARVQQLAEFGDLPLSYLAPFDIDQVPDHFLDYVISRTVLEHIPPDDMVALLTALLPKMKPGGLMVHLVDHSDHLEHQDKSISKINFLTWTESKHRFINFLLNYGENRLRHHEYPALFEKAGFSVIKEVAQVHEETRELSTSLALCPPYSEMSPEQVSTLTSIYILEPSL